MLRSALVWLSTAQPDDSHSHAHQHGRADG